MLGIQGGRKAFDLLRNQRGTKLFASGFTDGKQSGDTLKALKHRVGRYLLCNRGHGAGRLKHFVFWESKCQRCEAPGTLSQGAKPSLLVHCKRMEQILQHRMLRLIKVMNQREAGMHRQAANATAQTISHPGMLPGIGASKAGAGGSRPVMTLPEHGHAEQSTLQTPGMC